MADVSIVDTSVFCNVLNIPKLNDERGLVMEQLRDFLEKGTHLLLPMAVVYETGNHIAHISEGRLRRQCAELFVEQVKMAIAGETPGRVMQVPTAEDRVNGIELPPPVQQSAPLYETLHCPILESDLASMLELR
ncbi:hypothetical protein SPLC1_S510360 [Arthrospira platensis C1]|uniref:PIN domain-containing protein n=1 Tax=Limnospira maxima CS-328 TaxID=513049 RepID=B5VYH3_LIMMA|nr:hypothetical protein AmaxDRAFT_1565 [Limnospira maxima CS-328]EKD06923.1 hypothetical protein SPLC1_S510360 [Arthrospira platensis C1]UWU48216.1 hypothetical protein APLC1_3007 [Arthrospira platensis C1]